MLYVVLDSNALRQDLRLEGRGFNVLRRLGELGLVRVHVPSVVLSEVLAYVEVQHREVSGALKKAPRYALETDEQAVMDRAGAVAEAATERARERWKDALTAWIFRTGGGVLDVAPAHGARVLTAYFDGTPPFRGFDRDADKQHFPDAFIFEAVADLAASASGAGDPVLVVTEDKNLGGACAGLTGVAVYKHLGALVSDGGLRGALETAEAGLSEARSRVISALKQLLREDPPEELLDRLEEAARRGVYREIGSEVVVSGVRMEVEDIEAEEYPSFGFGEMEEAAPGLLSLPFKGSYEATVTYDVDIDTDYGEPDGPPEPASPGRDWFATGHGHGGFVERGAVLDLWVEGTLTLELPAVDALPDVDGSGFLDPDDLEWVGVRFESVTRLTVM